MPAERAPRKPDAVHWISSVCGLRIRMFSTSACSSDQRRGVRPTERTDPSPVAKPRTNLPGHSSSSARAVAACTDQLRATVFDVLGAILIQLVLSNVAVMTA